MNQTNPPEISLSALAERSLHFFRNVADAEMIPSLYTALSYGYLKSPLKTVLLDWLHSALGLAEIPDQGFTPEITKAALNQLLFELNVSDPTHPKSLEEMMRVKLDPSNLNPFDRFFAAILLYNDLLALDLIPPVRNLTIRQMIYLFYLPEFQPSPNDRMGTCFTRTIDIWILHSLDFDAKSARKSFIPNLILGENILKLGMNLMKNRTEIVRALDFARKTTTFDEFIEGLTRLHPMLLNSILEGLKHEQAFASMGSAQLRDIEGIHKSRKNFAYDIRFHCSESCSYPDTGKICIKGRFWVRFMERLLDEFNRDIHWLPTTGYQIRPLISEEFLKRRKKGFNSHCVLRLNFYQDQ